MSVNHSTPVCQPSPISPPGNGTGVADLFGCGVKRLSDISSQESIVGPFVKMEAAPLSPLGLGIIQFKTRKILRKVRCDMTRNVSVVIAAWAVWLISSVSVAAPNDAERARQAFNEAVSLYEAGDFPGAANKFRTCYQLKKSYRILYNIAQAEAASKRYGLSLETFEKYLAEGGDDIPLERQEEVREEIRHLHDVIGYIEVIAPDNSEIMVDGTRRGTYPTIRRIPVAVSVIHEIRIVSAAGMESETRRASVTGGDSVSIIFDKASFASEPVVAIITPPPSETEPAATAEKIEQNPEVVTAEESITIMETTVSPWKNRIFISGVIVGGAGIALMSGGIVTGIVSLKKNVDVEEKCAHATCDAEYRDLVKTRDRFAATSTVLWIAGGAATATGVALMFVWRKKRENLRSFSISMLPGIGGGTILGEF